MVRNHRLQCRSDLEKPLGRDRSTLYQNLWIYHRNEGVLFKNPAHSRNAPLIHLNKWAALCTILIRMETRWGWCNAPRNRGGRGGLHNPPTRNVHCPRHGITTIEQTSFCCCTDTARPVRNRRQQRKHQDSQNRGTTLPSHLSNFVDRIGCRLDQQSVILASRLDEITRRIDLLDLSQWKVVLLLRKPQPDDKVKDPSTSTDQTDLNEAVDVIHAWWAWWSVTWIWFLGVIDKSFPKYHWIVRNGYWRSG